MSFEMFHCSRKESISSVSKFAIKSVWVFPLSFTELFSGCRARSPAWWLVLFICGWIVVDNRAKEPSRCAQAAIAACQKPGSWQGQKCVAQGRGGRDTRTRLPAPGRSREGPRPFSSQAPLLCPQCWEGSGSLCSPLSVALIRFGSGPLSGPRHLPRDPNVS